MKCGETEWPLRLEGEIRRNGLLRLYPNTSATQQCERGGNSGEYSAVCQVCCYKGKKEKWESGDGRGNNNRDKGPNEQDPRKIAGDAASCVMDDRLGGRDLLAINCGTIFRTPMYCTASLTTSHLFSIITCSFVHRTTNSSACA